MGSASLISCKSFEIVATKNDKNWQLLSIMDVGCVFDIPPSNILNVKTIDQRPSYEPFLKTTSGCSVFKAGALRSSWLTIISAADN